MARSKSDVAIAPPPDPGRVLSTLLRGETSWASHLLMAPTSLWLLFLLVIPILLIVALSFAQRGPYGTVVWSFTVDNYVRALTPAYLPILVRSLGFATATTALCLALGYPLAYGLSFYFREGRAVLIILLMLPFWTSCLVALYSWIILLGREGLVNELLVNRLGLLDAPVQFLNRPSTVILGLVYFYLPFMVLPLYGSLEKVPAAYLEAAKDLGASAWQTFWKVTWPLSLPGVYAGCILTFIPCVGDFLTAEFLGGPNTYLLGNLIQNQFQNAQDWPFGAAMATLLAALLAGGLWLYQRLERGGVEAGRV
ncbi:MAG: ABC transporter permease [Elusimicrobia bacterium]|nr:ABC transporter permease [Elusimicrobiota bacterium]